MQITVDHKIMTRALEGLSRTLGKPTLPASTCIHMDADMNTGRLRLHSSDGAFHTLMSIPAVSISHKGEALVEASLFTGFVKTFNSDIKIEATANHGITMKYKRNQYHVPGIDPAMAITEPLTGVGNLWQVDHKDLKGVLDTIDYARLKKNGNPVYADIGVSIDNGTAHFLAADGYRVALAKLGAAGVPDQDMTVPARALHDIISLADPTQHVNIELFPNLIKFTSGDVIYYAPYSMTKFPPFHTKISRRTTNIVVDRAELIGALTRADLITSKADDMTGIMETAVQGDTLYIAGSSSSGGILAEEIPIINPGGVTAAVKLPARFLLDAVKRLDTTQIELDIDDAAKRPVLAFPEAGEEVAHLIMPFRPDQPTKNIPAMKPKEESQDEEGTTDSGDQGQRDGTGGSGADSAEPAGDLHEENTGGSGEVDPF